MILHKVRSFFDSLLHEPLPSSDSQEENDRSTSIISLTAQAISTPFSYLQAFFSGYPFEKTAREIFQYAYGMPLANFVALIDNAPLLHALKEMGIQISAPDSKGLTPLHHAAKRGSLEEMGLLLEFCKEQINVQDEQGRAPLHYAVKRRHIPIIQFLLQKGASQTVVDSYKKRPDSYANDEEVRKIFYFSKQKKNKRRNTC